MDTVSVVIPAHNGERHLAETLLAVAAQSHAPLDVTLVDDGCTDASVPVARDTGVRFQLITLRQDGVSRARNQGLAACRGDFVCFLDQDDVWHPQHLERQLACFGRHPQAGAVVSPYQHWYSQDGSYAPATSLWATDTGLQTDPDFTGWVYHQFMLDCWALTSATMVRRDVLKTHGAFDETLPYSEDWQLWLRLSREVQFAKLKGPAVLYRQHAVQGSRVARTKDYRCDLLLSFAARHGLASRDGRQVPRKVFDHTIARYQAEFGYHQLQFGQARSGVHALLRAWWRHPRITRPLALAAAGCLGWRPGMKP